ncbi:hypothetical protein ACJ4V0_15745 [Phreatobacter sp. HK31-P]
MTANPTPGPWWQDEDGFVAAGSGDSRVTVADFDCSPDIDIDEREANKLLAIAAPLMQQTLRSAISAFGQAFDMDEEINGADLVEWFSGWRTEAMAVVACVPLALPPRLSLRDLECIENLLVAEIAGLDRIIRASGMDHPDAMKAKTDERRDLAATLRAISIARKFAAPAAPTAPSDAPALATAIAGLEEISGRWPADMGEPEPENYDDTESAYSNGEDVGLHCCASIARETLAKLAAPAPSAAPPAPSDVPALDHDYAPAVAAGWAKVDRDPSPDRCEDGPVWYHAALDRAMPLDTSPRDLCREVGADDEEEPAPADPVKAEMLAALKDAHHEVSTDVDGISRDEALALISTLRLDLAAAIARAEGRA